MMRNPLHENATSNVLAWSSHAANVESAADEEAGAEADEPPDSNLIRQRMSPDFRRTYVTKPKENHASLLTRALQSASEGETADSTPARSTTSSASRRRRSITSEVSMASTADLTSDTGVSTPARTNSPSPRLVSVGFAPMSLEKHHGAPVHIVGSVPRKCVPAYSLNKDRSSTKPLSSAAPKDPAVHNIEKKRCISFACTAKPKDDAAKAPTQPAPAVAPQPRKPCIKFACPAKPERQIMLQTPPQKERLVIPGAIEESGSVSTVVSTPSTIRKPRSPVAARRMRPVTPQRTAKSPAPPRKKYITASSDELQREDFHFHEFASDHPHEEDWIRREIRDITAGRKKVTLDEILKKENDIRRLGKEAEEEAEQEEAEDEEQDDLEDELGDDDAENLEDEDELEQDVEDDQSGYGSDDDFSDGYNTDEDLGFADSDDEEDDDLVLWTLTAGQTTSTAVDATPVFRSASPGALSDSSAYSATKAVRSKHSRQRSVPRPMTPELPDSTDFVCGTMDEDRPMEEAYLTRITERKQEKLRLIPQDIDPSFPTSEPEDEEDDEDLHSNHDSGEPIWLHGELEELHDERQDRRRRKTEVSPKRMRSPPPPKRYHSPPPKARGRSPRRLFDRSSPKRIKSPAPAHHPKSPAVSFANTANAIAFDKSLAARPGLTHTKSLPRGAYFPGHIKTGKRCKSNAVNKATTGHMRGAIDIVKGLEQKRQRRKEKFHQKYCDRARKGQIPEKKAKAGEGAERMRELAGKMGQGHYVISV